MRALVLKTGATLLTLGAAVLSAGHVSAHLHSAGAQLRPPVVSERGGVLALTPAVRPADVEPVTSTYAS